MKELTKEMVQGYLDEQQRFFRTQKTRDVQFRIQQLTKLKTVIKQHEKELTEALYKDLHKSKTESYMTEIGYVYESISSMIKKVKKWSKPKKVKTPIVHFGSTSKIYPEPYGTVLIIGPFNYPFQLVMEPLVGALTAGNTAIIKPSKYTPNVSKVMTKMIRENFKEEYIRVVDGGRESTSALIHAPFNYIFFTGSVNVGKVVMAAASENLVPVTLELGGKSPCIVTDSANLKVAAKRIVWGKFLNAGQTCVAPDYILVDEKLKAALIKEMKKTIKVFFGEKAEDSPHFGRIVSERQFDRLLEIIHEEKVVHGGSSNREKLYIEPTLLGDITWEDGIMEDEIFGPLLPIISYSNLDDALVKVLDRPNPLALYLFSEDKKEQRKVLNMVPFGGGCVNDTIMHLANPYLPFGGVGSSGLGSYHGKKSFETFSHMKSVLKKSTKIKLDLVFPPYNEKQLKLIKRFMK